MLEGLGSLSLKKLKISSEDMYLVAPEHISGFFYSRRTRIEGLLSCSQVACFLPEVGGRWWLSWLNAARSRVAQCWHILLDILCSSIVSSRMVAFPLLLSVTYLNPFSSRICWCTRSMYATPRAINTLLASCCKSVKSWCRS
jgi:hypothetical protein